MGLIVLSKETFCLQLSYIFLKYGLPKTIQEYKTNMVIIPDLLAMFIQEPGINIREVESLAQINGTAKSNSSDTN